MAHAHWVAEVKIPELGWFKVPGEYNHHDYADSEAFRWALTYGGTDVRVYPLECDGSCKEEAISG